MNQALAASQDGASPSSDLVVSGLTELAFGALTGWVYAAVKQQPDAVRNLGVRAPDRIRQWHLELMMAGAFNVACGMAVPNVHPNAAKALIIGSWINPSAFLPLAFRPGIRDRLTYQLPVVAALVATSVGYTSIATTALRNRFPRSCTLTRDSMG
ncbi:hypothetical protein AAFP35_11665 [Gordonia sp. CPCC 206044]|uniref:hypothetical protein n=1 Tax=Gordonia sp. CPCC 206044 TaxID=3140793 RepID=UPI003AF3B510